MRVVKVPLADRSYSILIGSDLLARLGAECAAQKLGKRCAVISDRNVARLYGKAAVESLAAAGFDPMLVTVPAGETAKSLGTAPVVTINWRTAGWNVAPSSWRWGGVVGDLSGFVAATLSARGALYPGADHVASPGG